MLGKLFNPCYMLADKSNSGMFMLGLACFALVACGLITGKTIGEGKYHAIGGVVDREDSPVTFWWTMALFSLLGGYLWAPFLFCG